jgi:predicted DNA-binding protein
MVDLGEHGVRYADFNGVIYGRHVEELRRLQDIDFFPGERIDEEFHDKVVSIQINLNILDYSKYRVIMSQINIRIEKELDDLFTYLSDRMDIPKAVYVKKLLLENLREKILPVLLEDYKQGKIGLKRIIKLTGIEPNELLELISKSDIECPITPEIDDYTERITDELINKLSPK